MIAQCLPLPIELMCYNGTCSRALRRVLRFVFIGMFASAPLAAIHLDDPPSATAPESEQGPEQEQEQEQEEQSQADVEESSPQDKRYRIEIGAVLKTNLRCFFPAASMRVFPGFSFRRPPTALKFSNAKRI